MTLSFPTRPSSDLIETGLGTGELLPRHAHGVDGALHGQMRHALDPRQFGIQETHIESRIVDHQRVLADEGDEVGGDAGEDRLVLEEVVGQRSEEHTSELQSLMRISYAVFCLTKKTKNKTKR